MPITEKQVELYRIISAANAQAAEQYVKWANAMRDGMDGAPGSRGARGACAGRLDEVLSQLDQRAPNKARHTFLWAVTDEFSSTSRLTENQCKYLLTEMTRLEGEEYVLKVDTADAMRAATIALLKAGQTEEAMPRPKPQAQPQPKPQAQPQPKPQAQPQPQPSAESDIPAHEREVAKKVEENIEQGLAEFKSAAHAEAPVTATTIVEKDGFEWLFSVRAGTSGEMLVGALEILGRTGYMLRRFEFNPVSRYGSQAPPSRSSGGNGGDGPLSPEDQANLQQAAGGGYILDSGTKRVEYIQTNAEGKVQFKLEGLEYTLNDSRGAEAVAQLCADELSLGPEFFQPGQLMNESDFMEWYEQSVYADWIKKKKGERTYWDVTRVHL